MGGSSEAIELAVAGARVAAERRGAGPPVVVLHHSIGPTGWHAPWEELAGDHEVWLVDIPGYGRSERPAWARSVHDLALIVGRWIDDAGLAGATIVGMGLGGWVAAEIAATTPSRVRSMVLVGAAGLPPTGGAILDQFLISHVDYAQAYFADRSRYDAWFGSTPTMETLIRWDDSREMTARVSWKPYMYSRRLAPLLAGAQVAARVVWGEHDAVVPLDCGEQYATLLGTSLDVVPCGHAVDLESPDELGAIVRAAVTEEARCS